MSRLRLRACLERSGAIVTWTEFIVSAAETFRQDILGSSAVSNKTFVRIPEKFRGGLESVYCSTIRQERALYTLTYTPRRSNELNALSLLGMAWRFVSSWHFNFTLESVWIRWQNSPKGHAENIWGNASSLIRPVLRCLYAERELLYSPGLRELMM